MFIPTSVARMPIIRPAEPVITPADRSNSPPIISSATTTAGMPIVDATSVQFAMPSSCRNSEFCVQKKIATTIAASSAPISGRRRMRDVEADVRQPLVGDRQPAAAPPRRARPWSASFIACLRPPASRRSSTLALSTKPGPVRTGWPPPTVLALVLKSFRKTIGR